MKLLIEIPSEKQYVSPSIYGHQVCLGCGVELDLTSTYKHERICGECWRSLPEDEHDWDLTAFVCMLVSGGRTSLPEKVSNEEKSHANYYEEKWNSWILSETEREKKLGKRFSPLFFSEYVKGYRA